MDIQRLKQISEGKIKDGTITKEARDTLKEYKHNEQDLQLGLSETFKPIIKTQEETKQAIDDKQDKLIKQLQKNQKAITSGFENLEQWVVLPGLFEEKIPPKPLLPPKPKQASKLPSTMESNMNDGFDEDEQMRSANVNLLTPADVLKGVIEGSIEYDSYMNQLDEEIKRNGNLLGASTKNKKEDEPLLRAKSNLLKNTEIVSE